MRFGDIEITKDMFPSYQIGKEYPLRQYAFMQDTLSGALQKQAQLQNPQVAVPNNMGNQTNVWSGQ